MDHTKGIEYGIWKPQASASSSVFDAGSRLEPIGGEQSRREDSTWKPQVAANAFGSDAASSWKGLAVTGKM